MYALGALSRALDAIKAAAFSMFEDTLGFVMGLLLAVGFKGSGGGARSGSELSHLRKMLAMAMTREEQLTWAPMSDHILSMSASA